MVLMFVVSGMAGWLPHRLAIRPLTAFHGLHRSAQGGERSYLESRATSTDCDGKHAPDEAVLRRIECDISQNSGYIISRGYISQGQSFSDSDINGGKYW